MKSVIGAVLLLGFLSVGESFNKYGRTCKDIGCASNEQCILKEDPCSYYSRTTECGTYPTCERIAGFQRTCQTHTCPPGQICRMDGSTPKCVEDTSKIGKHVGYDTSNINSNTNTNNRYAPSAPLPPGSGSNVYPNIGNRGTTTRPAIYNGGGYNQGGYSGGSVGSGYPGGARTGYGGQGGYQGQSPGYGQTGRQGFQSGYPGYQGGSYQGGSYQGGSYQGGRQTNQGGYRPAGYSAGTYNGASSYPGWPGTYQTGYQTGTYQYGQPYQGNYQTGYQAGYPSGSYYGTGGTSYQQGYQYPRQQSYGGQGSYSYPGYGYNYGNTNTRPVAAAQTSDSSFSSLFKNTFKSLVGSKK